MMMVASVTPEDYARARRLLLRRDPVLAALIRKHGACGLASAQRADHFSALVRAITGQQLSTKAAVDDLRPPGRADARGRHARGAVGADRRADARCRHEPSEDHVTSAISATKR